MKSSILAFAASAALAAFAGSAPVITPSSVNISQSSPRKPVVLTYHVDKPAVVTVAFYNDGVEMPANLFTNLTGDVNRKVAAGNHTITWNPVPTWPDNSTTGKTFSAKITAWATNCPPDYMVVDLRDLNKRTHFEYYTSTNWLPGTLEDKRYRTTHMVMRKIPAANKSFWMGSPSGEWGRSPDWTPSGYQYDPLRENRHRVHLTNDFYMCIYPMTYRQHLYPNNFNFSYPLAAYYSNPGDFYTEGECWELPMCGVSYASLRKDGGDYKYWPKDGHDVQVSQSVENGLIGRSSICRRRRSGSSHAAPERPQPSIWTAIRYRPRPRPIPSTRSPGISTAGLWGRARRPILPPTRTARCICRSASGLSSRTPSASTTCSATCGSGALTQRWRPITRRFLRIR